MSFFSKLFGSTSRESATPGVPPGTDSRGLIRIAVQAAVDRAGGNCATLESRFDSGLWVQIMDDTVNAAYPHPEAPEQLHPELFRESIIAKLLAHDPGSFMTVQVREMNPEAVTDWIAAYFSEVLSADLSNHPLRMKMENL